MIESKAMQMTEVHIRQGANLPHWTTEDGIYSVTFRLADSLPQSVLKSYIRERDEISRITKKQERELSNDEKMRLQELYSDKVERFLDAGYGECWLREDSVADCVSSAITCFDGDRYKLYAWCIMPNHVHAVVQPNGNNTLEKIVHSWKSFTANKANSIVGRKGSFWQVEYFDHLIRSPQDFISTIEYVWLNPERAGLRNWKWRWIDRNYFSS
jgi:REP element-mobilizing transposase RayT